MPSIQGRDARPAAARGGRKGEAQAWICLIVAQALR
jgi:hypothetical protein